MNIFSRFIALILGTPEERRQSRFDRGFNYAWQRLLSEGAACIDEMEAQSMPGGFDYDDFDRGVNSAIRRHQMETQKC